MSDDCGVISCLSVCFASSSGKPVVKNSKHKHKHKSKDSHKPPRPDDEKSIKPAKQVDSKLLGKTNGKPATVKKELMTPPKVWDKGFMYLL